MSPEVRQKRRRKEMTEGQRDAPDRPEAERYYAQHASLEAGESGTSEAALQEAINEGARQSWKLIGGTKDPAVRAQSWCGIPPGSSPASHFDRKICVY
jgi:hypothetical protein